MFERYTSKLYLSPKTSIGGYVFDIYPSINHTLTATLTSHPTQYGASISDHKFDEPDQLVFQIGMSDASQDLVIGQFYKTGYTPQLKKLQMAEDGSVIKESLKDKFKRIKTNALNFLSNSRSVNAFNTLNRMKIEGVPLTCVTRLNTYRNMIITSVVADDTNETKYGLRATVTLREVMISELQKVQVNSTAQITQTTNMGSKNTLGFDLASKKEFTSTDYDEYGLGDF